MTYEYLVVQRTTRGTSGHECEELSTKLNEHARLGWRLSQIRLAEAPGQQIIIFEREKRCEIK